MATRTLIPITFEASLRNIKFKQCTHDNHFKERINKKHVIVVSNYKVDNIALIDIIAEHVYTETIYN